jgi:hypothetical protein
VVVFAHVDDAQGDPGGGLGFSDVVRALESDGAEAQFKLGDAALAFAGTGPHRKLDMAGDRQAVGIGKQTTALGDFAILCGARQQVEVGPGQPRESLVDIAFTVADDGDPCGQLQDLFGAFGAAQPTIRFFVLNRSVAARYLDTFKTCPNFGPDQSQTALPARLDRQHRMQEQPPIATVAHGAEPAGAAGMVFIVQLRGVLDRQNMQTGDLAGQPPSAILHQVSGRYRRVSQPAAELHLFGAPTRQCVQSNGRVLDHPLQQQCPLFSAARLQSSRHRSPSPSPTSKVMVGTNRVTRQRARAIQKVSVSQHVATCVHR